MGQAVGALVFPKVRAEKSNCVNTTSPRRDQRGFLLGYLDYFGLTDKSLAEDNTSLQIAQCSKELA